MHLIHRTTCRVCGSSALTKVVDFGEQYVQGSFVNPRKALPHRQDFGELRARILATTHPWGT